MPVLDVLSGNQLQAVSGRRGRPVLGDLLLQARADLPARMAFQQRERELRLQADEQRLQADAITRQEQAAREAAAAQARAQRQQGFATAISGVGQGALLTEIAAPGTLKGLATSAGIFSPATTTAGVTAGTTAEFGLAATPAAGPGIVASGGVLGALGNPAIGGGWLAGAGIVGAGLLASSYAGPAVNKLAGGGIKGRLAGAGAQAAVGALAGTAILPGPGTLVGAGLGFVKGLIGCVIVSAAHGRDSDEVRVARAFRDTHMTRNQLKGYYAFSEQVVPRMENDAAYKQHVTATLVDPLVRYGRFLMHAAPRPSQRDICVTLSFLDFLEQTGKTLPYFQRRNGEIVA